MATRAPSAAPAGARASAGAASAVADPGAADIGARMGGFVYDVVGLQRSYDDATTVLAQTTLGTPVVAYSGGAPKVALVWRGTMPAGFLQAIPADGGIKGPPGACPAGADPTVRFQTSGGRTVTPDLLGGLLAIPQAMATAPQTDGASLSGVINSLVRGDDARLKTAAGWNEMVWGPLRAKQVPASSLMDYQLWNASPGIESQISDLYLGALQSANATPEMIAAFTASARSGWYASRAPTAADALAKMDITAVMSGSVAGTVHEQRPFTIPGASGTPSFGTQTGDGTVSWDSPDLGKLTFAVDIRLDQFDASGRAIGGVVTGKDGAKGYDVRFDFKPDGSKEGKVFKAGQPVGQLQMSVDHERFENYVEAKTSASKPLPPSKGFAWTPAKAQPAISPPRPSLAIPKIATPSPPLVTGPPPGITVAPGVTGPPAVTGPPPGITAAPGVTGPPAITGPPAGIPPGYAPPPGYPGYPGRP